MCQSHAKSSLETLPSVTVGQWGSYLDKVPHSWVRFTGLASH